MTGARVTSSMVDVQELPPDRIEVKLVRGDFKRLIGAYELKKLGDADARYELRWQGQLELARGDTARAVSWLLEATDLAELAAYGEPAILRYDADTVEALVLAGDVDRGCGHGKPPVGYRVRRLERNAVPFNYLAGHER